MIVVPNNDTYPLVFKYLHCTTHALLRQSISHKTATEAETIQSTDCDVVTERLRRGMVVRGREKKGKGQLQLL
jgi:hypothetical protein